MKHPFDVLRLEYDHLLATVAITAPLQVEKAAHRLLNDRAFYLEVSKITGVPAAWLMAINEREGGGKLNRYLGNGQLLSLITTIVPIGRGPFQNWAAGAIDALNLDKISDVTEWSLARACFEGELWNGFGPRDHHGIRTGYLWGGTNHQQRGKYIRDGVWDGTVMDSQIGIVPLMMKIPGLDPSLAFGGVPALLDGIIKVPGTDVPMTPSGLAEGDVRALQDALNKLRVSGAPLVVDGSYGRRTRAAVMAFQGGHALDVDGLAGPKTLFTLRESMRSIQP